MVIKIQAKKPTIIVKHNLNKGSISLNGKRRKKKKKKKTYSYFSLGKNFIFLLRCCVLMFVRSFV